MRVLTILFCISLVTLTFGQVARLQLPGDINLSLFDFSILVTAGYWFYYAGRGKSSFRSGRITKPLIFFILTIMLSLLANVFRYSWHEILVACLYALRFVCLSVTYFVIKDSDESLRKRLPDYLVSVGGVILILGYVQYFFYANLRNLYYLGWDEHLYRMFSTFLDPNFLGAFLVLYFLFLFGYTVERFTKKKAGDRYLYSLLLSGLLCLTFIGIFLTTSRSAFIMLFAGLITYLFLIGRKKWIGIFLGIITIIFIAASPFFYLENINPFRIASSLARVDSGMHALEIITRNPVFGVGFNAYRYAQYAYGFRDPTQQFPSHADSSTDTSLLFVFATTGFIGFVSYIYLGLRIFRLGREKQQTVMGKILIASLVGIGINSLFINSLFYPSVLFWMFTIVALTDYT